MFKESLGEYLKRERELRQISLEEVAEGTKIAIYRLRAMEAGRWEKLPAEIFVKGFIKSYAEFIGLVPEDVILRYHEIRLADESFDEPTEPAYKPLFNYVNKVSFFNRELITAAAVLFLILLLLVMAIWFFWPSDEKHETDQNLTPSTTTSLKERPIGHK
ncbi:MAG: helix-turn-helix domain-containing protein [Deltaproteobacteria bacterium]|nr:helix-turn-helix domain-containing protein [Deltaproteobacteria bacterium]MBW1720003.1 helix-turn-helix domain-containing protein [Deltaproteobacteria bacterium]MBW1932995.1 helix-turn-helix domain-containing protein [Deltaproteobacteria bacterium]MBW1937247.1 helix-turn-helix domain-containing protein [Deltaproteobacteria bacterium]MBW1963700.1 helix-turn-helix domain-containing protein [Deltaproteobacteria bacterium]